MEKLKLSKTRFAIILILVLIGIALCLDLAYIFYKTNFLDHAAKSFCTVSELIDCDGVAKTQYSVSFGVPNALWGLFVYSIVLFLLFVDKIQKKFPNTIFDVFKNPKSYIGTLELLQFLLSMILAGISIFEIHKICALCFCTYFVDLFIALTASFGSFKEDIKNTIVDFIDGAKKYFVLFVVCLIGFVVALYYLDKTMIFSPKIKKERAQKEFYEATSNKYAIKGNLLGKENSPVTIRVYTDLNCPFCKVVNIMLHKLAKEEDVRIEEKHFPLDKSCNKLIGGTLGGHETSCMYAKYALAAKKQGKFWGAADVFYYKSPKTQEEILEQLKKAHLGLDFAKLNSDYNSPDIEKELQDNIEETVSKGIMGTPAIEINDTLYMGALPYDDLKEKVQLAKKRALNK